MKTAKERGPEGLWLIERRKERGYRNAELARRAIQAAGLYIAPSVYAEYESGRRRISDRHRPFLEEFWGPPEPVRDPGDLAPLLERLAAATERQALAIERLVELLEAGFITPIGVPPLAVADAELATLVDDVARRTDPNGPRPSARRPRRKAEPSADR